jgi:membrane protein DedA with SNARE-associated domain/membrane-associated phospholipid phosphatase
LVSALGAILGDLIGYLLGKKYGYTFILKYGKYFFFKKEYFEKTERLMNHHTGKALIIGRFNSLTRAFAPFVAGVSHVGFLKFFAYNIVGGISWALTFVSIGFIFGKGYEVASHYIGKFIFLAVVLSILLIYSYHFINKRKHIFAKYHLYALILNIFSLYLLSKMVEDVIDKESVTKLDLWINTKMVLLWHPLLNKIIFFITNMGSPSHLFLLSFVLLGILIYKKKWYYSLLLTFSMSGGLIVESLVKLMVHRIRPENALIGVSGYSFPSGHATMAMIFFSLLLYSFKDDIKNRILKNIYIISNVILFLLIGFSRVYLNVHWFSDVMAGFSLGLFWLTFLILVFKLIIFISKNKKNF